MSEVEEWRAVAGYVGLYEVSDHGRVRSFDRVVRVGYGKTAVRKGRILKPRVQRQGYKFVQLYDKTGQSSEHLVHVKVAEAFLSPDPSRPFVHHIDHDKSNNRADNLRRCTRRENSAEAKEAGRLSNGLTKRVKDGIDQIHARLNDGDKLSIVALEYGVRPKTLRNILEGTTNGGRLPSGPPKRPTIATLELPPDDCEVWRPIAGYSHQVSNWGRVRSLDMDVRSHQNGATRLRKGRILKPRRHSGGYVAVALSKPGTKTIYPLIHQLVVTAFFQPSPGRIYIHHIDFDRANNRAINLRLSSPFENWHESAAADRNGTKLTAESVAEIRRMAAAGGSHRAIGKALGIGKSTVGAVLSGLRWRHL